MPRWTSFKWIGRHSALLLAVWTGPAVANAQTTDVQAPQPRAAAAAPSRPALVADSSLLRHSFAVDPVATLAALDEVEAAVLRRALGDPDPLALGRWGDVLAASTQFFDAGLIQSDVAWWNPLLDAGLAVRWQWDGARWRIAAASPFIGASLRGDAQDLPSLDGRALRRLSVATRVAVASGAVDPLFASPSGAAAVLERARGASRALLGVGSGERAAAERFQYGRALLVGPPPGGPGGPALAAALSTLSPTQRRTLAPRVQASHGAGLAVAWASAGAADTLYILHYPNLTDVRARSVDVVPIIVRPGEEP